MNLSVENHQGEQLSISCIKNNKDAWVANFKYTRKEAEGLRGITGVGTDVISVSEETSFLLSARDSKEYLHQIRRDWDLSRGKVDLSLADRLREKFIEEKQLHFEFAT